MIMECASDFTYDEWLVKLADRGLDIGSPPSVQGALQVGRFFRKFYMGDELNEHVRRFVPMVARNGDESAEAEFAEFKRSVEAWDLPNNRFSPQTFGRAFDRLHYVEREHPGSTWRLFREIREYKWFVEAFGGLRERTELARLRGVAVNRGFLVFTDAPAQENARVSGDMTN